MRHQRLLSEAEAPGMGVQRSSKGKPIAEGGLFQWPATDQTGLQAHRALPVDTN